MADKPEVVQKEIDSNQKSIRWHINKVKYGDIKIPDFQRPFVWTQNQIIELLDSIYHEYPIGSLLFWETKEDLQSLRNIGGLQLPSPREDYPIKYVLDGQQRLSTLFGVLYHGSDDIEREETETGITDYDLFDVYFDLGEEEFLHADDLPGSTSPTLFDEGKDNTTKFVKVSEFVSGESYAKMSRRLPKKYISTSDKLNATLSDYQIPIVTIKGREKTEVGTIFERINNTGTDLNTLDLMVAWTWSEEFNLRERIDEIIGQFDEGGFGRIEEKRILQCLSSTVNGRIKTDNIIESLEDAEAVETRIENVKKSLSKTVDLLRSEFGVYSNDFLPSSFQLPPLVFFFSKAGSPNHHQLDKIRKWFWRTSFTNRYRDATNRRVHNDIDFFDDTLSGVDPDPNKYNTDVQSEHFFTSEKFNKQSCVSKAFILMLADRAPKDLLTGQSISIEETLSSYNRTEFHHVFPRKVLRDEGYSDTKINCLANICIISSDSNRSIGSAPPSEYLFEGQTSLLNGGDDFRVPDKDLLKSNLLPTDLDIYRSNNFERFVDERKEILYSYYDGLVT